MTGPDPRVAAARRAVRAAVADLPDDALVLVACSGGPDSLALAAAAAFAVPGGRGPRGRSDEVRRRAGAVVVDHGLAAGSGDVAARAAEQCRALGLDPVLVVRVDVAGPGGPEAAARAARYAALERAADETGAAAVLLGHTLDDQAETVLLGLARGSGARSLAGMPAVRGRLRRPFLAVRRADTLAVCDALGLDPWHDPTNAGRCGDPLRSRVRATVLPVLERELGPGVAAALSRTATQLREDAEALDEQAAALLHDAREHARRDTAQHAARDGDAGARPGHDEHADAVVLDVATLADAPPAVRRRALRAALVAAGAPAGSVHRVHVLELDALLTRWHGQGPLTLPGRVVAARRCGRLVVGPATRAARPGTNRPSDPESLWTGAAVDPADMGDDLEKVLLTQEQLHGRLDEIAAQVDADYADKDLLLVGVLKGAVMVMADLARRLHSPVAMDWMAVSSYGSGTKSSGVVRILKDLDTDLTGKHVLIVEDIIDSGLTLSWLVSNLRSRGPASVEIATMLRKPDAAKVEVDVRYVGFDIPSEFVVGYGLDYAERYRNLPFVGTLAPHVYTS
ncbi:hypoxanthine phosphoribosyltransferase [Cellulomonas uda]|uniref:tRNA(Ile)-lysidine synthase n=1 Tax=Cellulomonas uda TaxID=1714 RepID=A0A4Y3KDZ4_CELUD|nr:hypoxanthine phosphoribosyltransferase [Cellulomonas uda]GEA82193.1 hypothetical protein CUD01_26370 [Cellulomonas uda]